MKQTSAIASGNVSSLLTIGAGFSVQWISTFPIPLLFANRCFHICVLRVTALFVAGSVLGFEGS
jgi:hypothetical protein